MYGYFRKGKKESLKIRNKKSDNSKKIITSKMFEKMRIEENGL